jgi:hypothetical protein
MNSKPWQIISVILILVCVYLYWRDVSKPPITQGETVVTVDTVRMHDTIRVVKRAADFMVTREVSPVAAVNATTIDSAGTPVKDTAGDTAACYTFAQEYQDGAYAVAQMCSRYFPAERPADLYGSISYKPGDRVIRTTTRIDTIPKITYKPPVIRTWQAVLIGVAAGAVGTALIIR